MKGFPAHCESCDIIFEATGLVGGSAASRIKMVNNRTNCPKCGGWAELADGTFGFDDNALKLIEGPKWTKAQVRAIERAYRDMKQKRELTPGALDALERVSPELGAAAHAIAGKYGKSVMAVAMIGLLLSKCSVNIDVDVNDLIHGHSTEISQQEKPNQ